VVATYLSILRRRRWLIVAVTVLVAPLTFLALTWGQAEYESEASVLLGTDPAVESVLGQGGAFEEPERRMATELALLEGRAVAERAAEQLATEGWEASPRELSEHVEAAPRGFSRAIDIVGTDTDPARAQELTDAFVGAYVEYRQQRQLTELAALEEDLEQRLDEALQELDELDAGLEAGEPVQATRDLTYERTQRTTTWLEQVRLLQAGAGAEVEVLSTATLPESPTGLLPLPISAALALLGALFVAGGVALLVDLARDAVRTPAEVDRLVPVPTLAQMALPSSSPDELWYVLASTRHPTMAAARTLRIQLETMEGGGAPQRILVADGQGERDSLLVGGALAVASARAGRKTLLVADPPPELATVFGSEADGPSIVTHADAPQVRKAGVGGFWTAPATSVRESHGEAGLLDGFAPAAALSALQDRFEVVILVPPAGADVHELASLRPVVDRLVLVCALEETGGRSLRRLVENLNARGAVVDGLVLLHERDRRQRDGGSRTSSPPPSKELREPEAVTGR
jgi:hypothetical protein